MDHLELARALRESDNPHYNCCQSVLLPFARQAGLTEEQACALGAHFGGGMRHGSVCGALSGAMMALGALGYGEEQAKALLRRFRERHGATDCASLLKAARDLGESRRSHCDGLVLELVALLEELLQAET